MPPRRPAVPRIGQGSLTEQATGALLDSIMAGRFESGRLPPEPKLASLLGVSRTTVRAALQRLEHLGLLSRAPGRGTLVRQEAGRDAVVLQRLVGFHELLEERGHHVEVEQSVRVLPHPDPATVKALALEPSTNVVRLEKCFFADQAAAIYIWDELAIGTLNAQDAAILRAGRTPSFADSIFEFSTSWPGRRIDYSVVEIEPAVANDGAPAKLEIEAGEPYVVLGEVHYTQSSEPVAYSRVHVVDRFLRFKIIRYI